MIKNSPANAGDVKLWIQSLGREGSLEEDMAPVFLPGESHGQRKAGKLLSAASQRIRLD